VIPAAALIAFARSEDRTRALDSGFEMRRLLRGGMICLRRGRAKLNLLHLGIYFHT
jgi:hypothetical protein